MSQSAIPMKNRLEYLKKINKILSETGCTHKQLASAIGGVNSASISYWAAELSLPTGRHANALKDFFALPHENQLLRIQQNKQARKLSATKFSAMRSEIEGLNKALATLRYEFDAFKESFEPDCEVKQPNWSDIATRAKA